MQDTKSNTIELKHDPRCIEAIYTQIADILVKRLAFILIVRATDKTAILDVSARSHFPLDTQSYRYTYTAIAEHRYEARTSIFKLREKVRV